MNADLLPIRMSTEAFAATWADTDEVEAMPTPLLVPTWAEDEQAWARQCLRAMQELDPLTNGDPKDFLLELGGVYRSLATAPLEYCGWVQRADGTTFGVQVACHGRTGFRAVVDEGQVVIDRVGAEPSSLVVVLPDCAPAKMVSASAPFDQVGGPPSAGVLTAAVEHTSRDVDQLRTLLASAPLGKGQLTVACRSKSGRRTAHREPVNYVDLDAGRVVFYRDGRYLTAVSGTPDVITARLNRLRRDLD